MIYRNLSNIKSLKKKNLVKNQHEISYKKIMKSLEKSQNLSKNQHKICYAGSRINFLTTFPDLKLREVSSDFPYLQISSSALLDIQLTLFCVCEVDSFLLELEHLYKIVFTVSFPKRRVRNLGVFLRF